MKTLKLTLKKEWFNLIEKGIKKEEYREIKSYWIKRLAETSLTKIEAFKHFDYVEFTNGYLKNSPKIKMQCLGIDVGTGKMEWGAIGNTNYFIIKIGIEVSRKNC